MKRTAGLALDLRSCFSFAFLLLSHALHSAFNKLEVFIGLPRAFQRPVFQRPQLCLHHLQFIHRWHRIWRCEQQRVLKLHIGFYVVRFKRLQHVFTESILPRVVS